MASSNRDGQSDSHSEETHEPSPRLHREAELRPPRVVGLAPILAACTLAGLFFGFGLRSLSQSMGECQRARSAAVTHVHGDVTWLGVEIRDSCRHAAGAAVVRVFPGSPAEAAGLQPGDVIVQIRDRAVTSARDLVREVRALRPGIDAEIAVRHRGQEPRTVHATLSTVPGHLQRR